MIKTYKVLGVVTLLAALVMLAVAPMLSVVLAGVWILLALAVRSREKDARHQEMLEAIKNG